MGKGNDKLELGMGRVYQEREVGTWNGKGENSESIWMICSIRAAFFEQCTNLGNISTFQLV